MRLLPFLLLAVGAGAEDGRLLLTQVVRSNPFKEPGKACEGCGSWLQLWSHGSSTPVALIPSDAANDAASWVEGLGSLTQRGREEALRLGALLNARYVGSVGLLKAATAQRQAYVRAADCNRTLTSAAAVMAGLLPLDPAQLGSKAWPLYWQPFPVHSVPADADALLSPDAPCPRLAELIPAQLIASPAFQSEENLVRDARAPSHI